MSDLRIALNDRTGRAVAVAGAGLLICIGSFLPWVTAIVPLFGNLSLSGVSWGDGWVTLIAGIVLVAVSPGIARHPGAGGVYLAVGMVSASVAGGVVAYDLFHLHGAIQALEQSPAATARVGAGLVVLIVAVVLAVSALAWPVAPADEDIDS